MIEFKGSHFERDVILWGVRWYVGFPISYRQLEEMMEERGVEVDQRGLLTNNQAAKVDALKSEWREFATMRALAMRFRRFLRSKNVAELGVWMTDAHQSGPYPLQRFARTLRRDIDAVRSAVTDSWSNGQTEGQINRLKTLKRAMYGRAGPELLRARMLPL